MKIYALLSNQGTAASETAVCEKHIAAIGNLRIVAEADVSKWEPLVDVSDNDALVCVRCGAEGR